MEASSTWYTKLKKTNKNSIVRSRFEIPVSHQYWLEAMETRARIQEKIITHFHANVITFTVNIPGPIKSNPAIYALFNEGLVQLRKICDNLNSLFLFSRNLPTGPEAYFMVSNSLSCSEIKKSLLLLENEHPLGPWYDVDIISEKGRKISRNDIGEPLRRCFLCNKPAKVCRKEGNHSMDELQAFTDTTLSAFLRDTDNGRIHFNLF